MRAVILTARDGCLQPAYVDNVPVPEHIPPHHVRIRVRSASLNPVDGKYDNWRGLMERGVEDPAVPFVLGLDGAGTIDALGEHVDGARWALGARVAFHLWLGRGDGSFADFCIAHEGTLVSIPPSVSDEAAAATPCAMWTAYKAVVSKLRVSSHAESLLVTSGAGGVGCFAIQIARALGAKHIIATCSADASSKVVNFGAHHCIDYRSEPDIAAAVRRIAPNGVQYAVDSVSSDSATNLIKALAIDGELASVAGSPIRDASVTFLTGFSLHDVCLGFAAYKSGRVRSLLGDIGEACMALLADGRVDPFVGQRTSLEQLPAFIERASQGISGGKVVVDLIH